MPDNEKVENSNVPAPNPEQNKEEEVITLRKEDFQKILADIAATKSTVEVMPHLLKEMDKQEEELKNAQKKKEEIQNIDFENMSNRELVKFMQENVAQPLMQEIMGLQVKLEIKDCSSKYEDFKDYREDSIKIAMDNPNLSIEEAYKLAKTKNPSKGKKEESKPKEPSNESKPKAFGEKPSGIRGMSENVKLSSKDAALKALEELNYGKE